MKKALLLMFVNAFFINLQSQNFNWAKREGLYAYDYGEGITTDNSGNVYVAGKYEQNANFSDSILPLQGNHDIFLAKYSSNGALNWTRTAGGIYGDYATSIACDGLNYVYVAGEIEGFDTPITFPGSSITLKGKGGNDVLLMKYDLSGNLLWARSAGGFRDDKAMGITYDKAGNVYICGSFTDTAFFGGSTTIYGNGMRDIYIAKYDLNGNFQWVRNVGSPKRDEARSIKSDSAGNVYICGLYYDGCVFGSQILNSANGFANGFLAKYSTNGDLIWVKVEGGDYDDVAWSLTMDKTNKIYVTGEFNAYAHFDAIPLTTHGNADIFVACYDTSGNVQWAKSVGGTLIDRARGIGTYGSNLYITGQFGDTVSFDSDTLVAVDSSDIFMAAMNNNGDFIWATSVGGPPDNFEPLGFESGNSIFADTSGNVYATGGLIDGGVFGNTSLSPYARTDIFITKITQGADTLSPIIISLSPADNAISVPQNSNLVLTFNKPVQKGSGNIIIKEGGIITQTIPVSGSKVSVSWNVVTIDAADFTSAAEVNIEMAAGVIKDISNNDYAGITSATNWNFTIADVLPPVIISLNPADNAIGVTQNSNLVLTFNKPVQKGSGNIIIKEGGIITQTIPVSGNNVVVTGNSVTIDPADFTNAAEVNIEMAAGVIKDISNNDYAGITSASNWNFTIADIFPPVIISLNPADNAIGVTQNSNLVLTFNKPVQKGSGNIIIKEGGIITQTIPVSGNNVVVTGNSVTIDPADFTNAAEVNIEMAAGVIKDISNNDYAGITSATNWDFTIADVLPPVIISLTPADNAIGVTQNSNLVLTFNKPVQKGSGNIIIKEGGIITQTIPVSGNNVSVSGNSVTIDPADFTNAAEINVEIVSGVIKDLSNNDYPGISDATSWNFTVENTVVVDVIPPVISSLSPADNAISITKNSNLILTFNEAVQKGSGDIIIKEGGIVTQTIPVSGSNVSISGNTVTIDPADFTNATEVNVEIVSGVIKDLSNNDYAGISDATSWNFTVENTVVVDVLPPIVSSLIPADNAIAITKNSNLILTFNEAVQKGSGEIIIKEGGIITQTIPVSGSNVSISGNTVTIDPTDFTSAAEVNIEMAVGVIKDISNNDYAGITSATNWNFTIADVLPPVIISLNPADNAIGVTQNSNLVLTFNETVQKGSGDIIIKEGGIVTQTIPVSGSNVSISGNTVTIDPADFTNAAEVNVEIVSGVIKDLSNNDYAGISDATSWNFTVENTVVVDVIPPVVSSLSPPDNAISITKNSNLILTFNETVQNGSGDIIIKEGGIVTQTIPVSGSNVSISGNTVTIDPADFTNAAEVNVEIVPGVIKDLSNNDYAGILDATSWNFTVENTVVVDVIPPVVSSLSPADNAIAIAKNSNLVLTFNEALQKGSGEIIIKEGGVITQTIPVSGSNVSISGNTVTIDPADFTNAAEVNVEIVSGVIKDLSNNDYAGILDATSWNFTIADSSPPMIDSLSPADNAINVAKNSNLILTFNKVVQKGNGDIIIKEGGIVTQTIPVTSGNIAVSGNTITIDPADFTSSAEVSIDMAAGVFTDVSNNECNSIANDTSWNFTIDTPTSTIDTDNKMPFIIYPNPVSSILTINLDSQLGNKFEMIISNCLGQVINKGIYQTTSKIDIDLSAQEKGMYFILIKTEDQSNYRKKIILQ